MIDKNKLRKVTVRDVLEIAELTNHENTPRSFALQIIMHKLKDSDLTDVEVALLNDEELTIILIEWFSFEKDLNKKFENHLSLAQVVEIIKKYIQDQQQKLLTALKNVSKNIVNQNQSLYQTLSNVNLVSGMSKYFDQMKAIALHSIDYRESLRRVSESLVSLSSIETHSSDIENVMSALMHVGSAQYQVDRIAIPSLNFPFDVIAKSAKSMLDETAMRIKALHTELVHLDTLENFRSFFQHDIYHIQSLVKTLEITAFSQVSLVKLSNFSGFERFSNERPFVREYHRILSEFTDSYADFVRTPLPVNLALKGIMPIVAIELFSTSDVVESLILELEEDIFTTRKRAKRYEVYEENREIVRILLHKLNPSLVKMLDGANQVLHSDNPERIRYFCVSMREILTQILQILAPDEEIKKWSSLSEFYDKGKITRKARLSYIHRNLNSERLSELSDKIIHSTLEIIGTLNKGTHGLNFHLTDDQLLGIKLKIEITIRFILEVEYWER